MKGLQKLALASAVMAVSTGAFAMEALDDSTLSATTGQAGLTITMGTDIEIGKIRIHDTDGLDGITATHTGYGAYSEDASIVITGVSVTSATDTSVRIDAGSTAAGASVLHIEAALGATDIGLDGTVIGVAAGDGTGAVTSVLAFNAGTELALGAMTLNIDLGSQPTGNLIYGRTTMANDVTSGYFLELSSLNITQGAEAIGLTDIGLSAVGGTFGADLAVNVRNSGLEIGLSNSTALNVSLGGVTLGSTPSIGAVYIDNLTLGNNTITVAGH